MGDRFLDDQAGGNTTPFETWANAATTLSAIITDGTNPLLVGEKIYVAQGHSEEIASNVTHTFPGTYADPNILISVDDTGDPEPPTAGDYLPATSVQIGTTSNNNLVINGVVRCYGIYWQAGKQFSLAPTVDDEFYLEDGTLDLIKNDGVLITGANDGRSEVILKNSDIKFSTSGSGREWRSRTTLFDWRGGTLTVTGTEPSVLINPSSRTTSMRFAGVDLSDYAGSFIDSSDLGIMRLELHHCLLNSSFALQDGALSNGSSQLLMSGCDDTTGNKLYRMEYETFYGTVQEDAAIFVTIGGASDGTTPISWKMDTNANATEFFEPLISPPIILWLDTTVEQVLTVQCNWDEVSTNPIQNDEIWLEVEFLSASGDTESDIKSDGLANPLEAPVNQTTATTLWDGDGGFSDQEAFTLDVTITPGRVGLAIGRVHMGGRAGAATIYVDPKMTSVAT